MKIIFTALLFFLSANVDADTIYRCGNSYQLEPCHGVITKILNYTPMTQEQKNLIEFTRLEQVLKNDIENEKMETIEWQQLELQRQIATANQVYLNAELATKQKLANYDRAWAIMLFKHGRKKEIRKSIKDQEDKILDNMAWQLICCDQ